MTDDEVRAAERRLQAEPSSPARLHLLRTLSAHGRLTIGQLALAARLGDTAAAALLTEWAALPATEVSEVRVDPADPLQDLDAAAAAAERWFVASFGPCAPKDRGLALEGARAASEYAVELLTARDLRELGRGSVGDLKDWVGCPCQRHAARCHERLEALQVGRFNQVLQQRIFFSVRCALQGVSARAPSRTGSRAISWTVQALVWRAWEDERIREAPSKVLAKALRCVVRFVRNEAVLAALGDYAHLGPAKAGPRRVVGDDLKDLRALAGE